MAVIVTNISCELTEPVKVQYLDGNLFSMDKAANKINVNIYNNGAAAIVTGTVSATVTRSDGETVVVVGSLSRNVATITLPQAAYHIPGVVNIAIKISSSGAETTIGDLVANVYKTSTEAIVDPGVLLPSIADLIAQIESAVASIPADYSSLWSSLAPPFDPNKSYNVGEYVTNNGCLYKFIEEHTGNWNINHVEIVTLGENIYQNRVDINGLNNGQYVIGEESVNKLNPNDIAVGYNIRGTDGVLVANSDYDTTGIIYIPEGAVGVAFTGINADGNSRACLPISRIAFYNEDDSLNHIEYSVEANTVVSIPTGSVYVRIANQVIYFNTRNPMVEFVATTADIAPAFVPYGSPIKWVNGIIYIDDKQKEIIGVYESISGLTTFQRGSIVSGDGSYSSSSYYDYRVATPEKVIATKDYIISIDAGFRVYLFVFDAQGNKVQSSWVYDEVHIKSGTIFRMAIGRIVEDRTETADVDVFCSKVKYWTVDSIKQITWLTQQSENMDAIRRYGLTWDWWITSNSIDAFGNSYIGYVDTEGYAGVIRRQPDGVMQCKRLEPLNDNDDHNASGTIVLDDGRVLVVGSFGHTANNYVVCWRGIKPYSIDEMEKLSFFIPETGANVYRTTYSQIFKYNGAIFVFLRCVAVATGGNTGGYLCLVSTNNGTTWTAYKAITGDDPYVTFNYSTDDDKYLKAVYGRNPSASIEMLRGFVFNMNNRKFYNLAGTEIGSLVELNGGSLDDVGIAHYENMTDLIQQGTANTRARLFTVAKTEKSKTVFLYAVATDSTMHDFIYYLYNDGTVVELGHSGIPFANNHYISGVCFGKDTGTIYYCKATTSIADGDHELHKVIVESDAVQSDEIIAESSICMIRPLFLGNGEIAVSVGNYNDQNPDGTYNRSFKDWQLNPLFVN